MSGVIYTVNRYEYYMENNCSIRTFCGCKPSKNNIESHQNYTAFNKRPLRLWMISKMHRISKSEKANKFYPKLSDQHKVRLN